MIVRPRPGALELWTILRGSIVPRILPQILAIVAYSAVLSFVARVAPGPFRNLNAAPFTLFGLALSIFLGFRNNASYERWWEARRQWGQLIAEVRGYVRDCMTLLPQEEARRSARRAVAFAHALRAQLRRTDPAAVALWLEPGAWAAVRSRRSLPDAILADQATEFRELLRRRVLTDNQDWFFAERLQAMTTIQTACERLANTPMPFTYALLLHRTAWLFLVLVPFGLVDTLGLATPIATAILAYAFFGLDALGEELEDPFGTAQNAVPLDALVRAIEIAALEGIGAAEVPEPLRPVEFLLL